MVEIRTPQQRLCAWLAQNWADRDFWIEIVKGDTLKLTMQERRYSRMSWVETFTTAIGKTRGTVDVKNPIDSLIERGLTKWEAENHRIL